MSTPKTRKSKASAAKQTPQAAKLDPEKLLEIRESLRGECLVYEDVAALRQKILGGVNLLRYSKIAASAEYQQDELVRRVFQGVESEIVPALNGLLSTGFEALMEIVRMKGPESAGAVEAVTDSLTRALQDLARLSADEEACAMLRQTAGKRMMFPGVISIFKKESEASEATIRGRLNLGGALPFKVDPAKSYNAIDLMAMEIVREIDRARLSDWEEMRRPDGSLWKPATVYRKVAPGLHGLEFRDKPRNVQVWEEVINFHMDFFQGPQRRQAVMVEKYHEGNLEPDLERYNATRRDRESFWAFGDLASIPQLQEQFKDNKKAKGDMFGVAKYRISEYAMKLIREPAAD